MHIARNIYIHIYTYMKHTHTYILYIYIYGDKKWNFREKVIVQTLLGPCAPCAKGHKSMNIIVVVQYFRAKYCGGDIYPFVLFSKAPNRITPNTYHRSVFRIFFSTPPKNWMRNGGCGGHLWFSLMQLKGGTRGNTRKLLYQVAYIAICYIYLSLSGTFSSFIFTYTKLVHIHLFEMSYYARPSLKLSEQQQPDETSI